MSYTNSLAIKKHQWLISVSCSRRPQLQVNLPCDSSIHIYQIIIKKPNFPILYPRSHIHPKYASINPIQIRIMIFVVIIEWRTRTKIKINNELSRSAKSKKFNNNTRAATADSTKRNSVIITEPKPRRPESLCSSSNASSCCTKFYTWVGLVPSITSH